MQTITLKAPAKINLYLNVLNKRSDGFHNLETVFEKLEFSDKITLTRRRSGIKLICASPDVPKGNQNIAVKAARLILKCAHNSQGVEIKLNKKIPVAAGLGGGSSDAAAVLLGINRLFGLGFDQNSLQQMGLNLGADVPFFLLRSSRAIGRGIGEILLPLAIKKSNWYILVVVKGLYVSTEVMYKHPRLTLTKPPADAKIMLHTLKKGNLTALDKHSYNSFESIVAKKYKEINQIKQALKSLGAHATLMSGSGPCVFGIAQSRKEAMTIAKRLQKGKKNWRVVVTSTYNTN